MYGMCQGGKPHPGWQSEEEGPMLHDGVHLFDLFRMFAGDPLAAAGTARRYCLPFAVEDDDLIMFEFPKGVGAVALVNERTRYARFELEIQGTEGMLRLNDAQQLWWTSVHLPTHRREPDPLIEWWGLEPKPFPEYRKVSPILEAIRDTIACVESGAVPASTGEDGVASIEMCMAIYESELRGNARVTLPLAERKSQLHALRAAGKL